MVSAFLEVLHHALPLGLCAVNGRGHPEQGLVSLPIILIIHNWHPVLMTLPEAVFFATWPFLAIRNVRVLGFTDDDDDETGLPPLNPLVLRTENRQIFIANFFFQKKIWRQNFFGDFNQKSLYENDH